MPATNMHHVVPKVTYYTVAAILGVLLVITAAAARVDLGGWNVPVALAIATAKAALIVLYFMHVRYGSPLVRLFAAGGFLWLAIMLTFIAADVVHRR
ncbi:MAG: cytochrome C oxidase subunit IV family protein [Pirellulales bacterium]